jgi:hypothetical protein
MPEGTSKLLADDELLESFAWELLRVCGPKVETAVEFSRAPMGNHGWGHDENSPALAQR